MINRQNVTLSLFLACATLISAPDLLGQEGTQIDTADFAKIDRDGDGFVDALEVVVFSAARSGEASVNTDFDRDGKSTSLEVLATHAHWARALDANRDGKLSREEFVAGRGWHRARDERIDAKFRSADKNGDGAIDAAEIQSDSKVNYDAWVAAIGKSKGKLKHQVKSKGKVATAADYHEHHKSVFAVADIDKDGRITAAEYMQWTKAATR